jgi:branched-subunit amino acid aminotransferase/4-amino-4-deoxychorismate lyase
MLLLNDALLPTATLPLPNRGLAFGDGFFETLVLADGRLRYAAEHVARMQQAAAALYLMLPPSLASATALQTTLLRLATANDLPAARVRLQLWRGGGGRYAPPTPAAEWLATAEPFTADSTPVGRAGWARENYALPSPLSFCKGPQAWLYVRAAHERQQRGLDEIILCTAAGHVAEAGAAAIFWIKDGQLFTPALTTGCVAGVRRAHLLGQARAHGVPCQEGHFAPAAVLAAEAVFTANVTALKLVQQLEGQALPTALPALWAALQRWDQEPG